MDTLLIVLFWTSAVLTVYAYVGYPLLIHGLGRLTRRSPIRGETLPGVSLVVPAYNETHVIRAKLENCMQLDYPNELLEILVGSDGSTDGTAETIRDAANASVVRGVIYPTRRGKAAVLNDLVRMASGDIVAFSDAASMLEPRSIRALVRNFADPRVGCVSGVYRVRKAQRDVDAKPEDVYWRYETFIRLSETRLGTMLGAHGAMYAIRLTLFEPLDPGLINDDFIIPMRILLRGFHSIYDTDAVAWEPAAEMAGFGRRIRIMTGNYQQLALLLSQRGWQRRPWLLFQLLSHKGLRLVTPFLLVGMYAANAGLLAYPGYRLIFAGQTLFFVAAVLGLSPRLRRLGAVVIAAPYYFCMLNAAALVGLYHVAWRRGAVAWKAR